MPSTVLAFKRKYSDILVILKHLSQTVSPPASSYLGGFGTPFPLGSCVFVF